MTRILTFVWIGFFLFGLIEYSTGQVISNQQKAKTEDTFTAKFFWSFVYEKMDNEWKVIQSHQSNLR